MDAKPLDAGQLIESLRAEFEHAVREATHAVDSAPPGRVIAGSEQEVKAVMDGFRARVMERLLQARADSVESAFSPGAGPDGQGQVRPLDADGMRPGVGAPSPVVGPRRGRHDAGRRGAGHG